MKTNDKNSKKRAAPPRYDEAFRAGAVRMVTEQGRPSKEVAQELGNCIVSLAPFDFLHGKYKNTGIIWIDAHPDVSTPKDGYPNAHAMVLGSLMGYGDQALTGFMKNETFKPEEVLYVGLQGLHDYQTQFLNRMNVQY